MTQYPMPPAGGFQTKKRPWFRRTAPVASGVGVLALAVGVAMGTDAEPNAVPASFVTATELQTVMATETATAFATVTAEPTSTPTVTVMATEFVTVVATEMVTVTETVTEKVAVAAAVDLGDDDDDDDSAPAAVYYKNCSAAKAAGAAPVRRGDPGYGKHLDRDGDGVGCES